MHPILTVLHVGDAVRPIGTYGALLAAAIVVATLITVRAAARARLDVGATIAIVGLVTGGAMAGGYSLFFLVEWARTGDPMTAVHSPGLVFLGAPVGGALAYALSARKLDLPAWKLLDLSIVALPAAHAIGRVGCFFGGCCYGQPWDGPLAVTYTHPIAPGAHPSVPRHPAPLYEAAALLAVALVFALVPLRDAGSGRRALTYGVVYGLLRIGVEAFRGDAYRGVWLLGLSTSQILGAALSVGCGVALALRGRQRARAA